MNWAEWLNRNPLQMWMKENNVTQMQVASYLNASPWTVYAWRTGARPKVKQESELKFWRRLKELTGDEDIQVKWLDWEDEKPHPREEIA